MKKRVKSLALHRETLLGLQGRDGHHIAGGATVKTICHAVTCPVGVCVVTKVTECGGPRCP
jgi:hypothetical protein